VDERAVFCPACGAPQIRVPLPSAEAQEPALENETDISSPVSTPSRSAAPVGEGIRWKTFFIMASPLAALTGFIACLFPPLTVVIALPITLRRVMARYRRVHPGLLRSEQGAGLGAFMALLSFVAFLIFFLPMISLNRDVLLKPLHDQAARNPGPQTQQLLAWATSAQGFPVFVTWVCIFILLLFITVGVISGAIMASPKKRI
jgi:uncharacterized membrane protein YhaH (DUF805 family)